jgi:hypothetical protein
MVVPLGALPTVVSTPQVQRTKKSVYEVQPRGKSISQFDVVVVTEVNGVKTFGKKMNETVLTKEKAVLLANDLNK